MTKDRSNVSDMTKGVIWKKILLFAAPLLVGSLVQQLYNTVDLIFVGNFINKSASAAIGASSLFISCLIGFFGGLSVGTSVVTANIFGSGDEKKLEKVVHNGIALSVVGGMILSVAGYVIAPLYLKWVNTPAELQMDAVGYLRIYFFSFISIMTYNIGSGICRAMGDSKAPLFAQIVGGLVNVVMDYLFLRFFANGINGVAWATFFSQTCAALVIVYRLKEIQTQACLQLRKVRFDRETTKEVIRIGVPAGLQSVVITFSNIMVQFHINSFGEDAIAAFTAYFKVELIVYLPIMAFSQAVMTFAGQNKGAKKEERIVEGTIQSLGMSILLAMITSFCALRCGEQLFRIFNKEQAVVELGCQIIRVTFPFYFLYSILQLLGDSIRGCGETKKTMLIVLNNICIVRTGLLFLIVPRASDIRGVAVVYPITWLLTAVCMSIYFTKFHIKQKKVLGLSDHFVG